MPVRFKQVLKENEARTAGFRRGELIVTSMDCHKHGKPSESPRGSEEFLLSPWLCSCFLEQKATCVIRQPAERLGKTTVHDTWISTELSGVLL